MKKTGIAVLALLIAGGVAWAIVANTGGDHTASTNSMDTSGHGQTTTAANVAFDQQFIDDMVPHHEMAVEMANIVLERGKRPELREMAEEIVTAQTTEIKQMKDWRKVWFGSSDTPMQPSHAMPGMDIAAVENAPDVDKAFIDEMILHHQSAVEMATEAQEQGEHQEIRDLAGRIISAQQTEISMMETWRTAWYG